MQPCFLWAEMAGIPPYLSSSFNVVPEGGLVSNTCPSAQNGTRQGMKANATILHVVADCSWCTVPIYRENYQRSLRRSRRQMTRTWHVPLHKNAMFKVVSNAIACVTAVSQRHGCVRVLRSNWAKSVAMVCQAHTSSQFVVQNGGKPHGKSERKSGRHPGSGRRYSSNLDFLVSSCIHVSR